MSCLAQSAEQLGIETGYWDIQGNWCEASTEALEKLIGLRERGIQCSNEIASGGFSKSLVVLAGAEIKVPNLAIEPNTKSSCWKIFLEDGNILNGELSWSAEFGAFVIPPTLVEGYHHLEIIVNESVAAKFYLIVCPDRCFVEPLRSNHVGVSTQLYSLCPSFEKGIGDFEDLLNLAEILVSKGCSFLGINPLHAIGFGEWSPYSPISRFALNIIYISENLLRKELGLNAKNLGKESASNAQSSLVDYPKVEDSKRALIFEYYQTFRSSKTALVSQFEDFLLECPETLRYYANYCVLQRHFSKTDSNISGWQQWPSEYHDHGSEPVTKFCLQNKWLVEFELFCQWVAKRQLKLCADVFKDGDGLIGLYSDLALGVRANSVDVWIFRSAFCLDSSMGAPPDSFNPNGQDWGLPPLDPSVLDVLAYKPFILALQAVMKYSGAVRVDHVMSLFRVYWTMGSGQGAYVRYPVEELFRIVALESKRNSCLVVGEDLGTVPDEVRDAMNRYGVLSYKVLIFMRDWDGGFIQAEHYAADALVTVSTHDLPTIAAYVSCADIREREAIELHSAEVIQSMFDERGVSIEKLRERLNDYRLVEVDSPQSFVQASAEFIRDTPCKLKAIQIEDLALEDLPANVPGTTTQRPNWRRKLSKDYQEVLEQPWVSELLEKLVDY